MPKIITPKTRAQVQSDMLARRRDAGWKRRPVWLQPEALARLDRLRERHPTMTFDEMIAAGLERLEAQPAAIADGGAP